MNKLIKLGIALGLVLLAFVIFQILNTNSSKTQSPTQAVEKADSELRIVSTNPQNLDGTTILPTQSLEINFNKPIPKSEFKHQMDPGDLEYEIEALNGPSGDVGQTIKIIFKKPLPIGGAAFTLTVKTATRTDDKIFLDHEYIYHFKTISYKGV
jgi:hypothetical protein